MRFFWSNVDISEGQHVNEALSTDMALKATDALCGAKSILWAPSASLRRLSEHVLATHLALVRELDPADPSDRLLITDISVSSARLPGVNHLQTDGRDLFWVQDWDLVDDAALVIALTLLLWSRKLLKSKFIRPDEVALALLWPLKTELQSCQSLELLADRVPEHGQSQVWVKMTLRSWPFRESPEASSGQGKGLDFIETYHAFTALAWILIVRGTACA